MLNSLKSGNRLRVDFAKNPQQIEIPNLLQLQQNSYDNFLMIGKDERTEAGIDKKRILTYDTVRIVYLFGV